MREVNVEQGGGQMEHTFLVHNDGDHVGVAVVDIAEGQDAVGIVMDSGRRITVKSRTAIPLGHKIAIADLENGTSVLKYLTQIGRTSAAIRVGDHVHTHNLRSARW
jgi:(2R)-sulfolactate sulfo-lyase subunit alpha